MNSSFAGMDLYVEFVKYIGEKNLFGPADNPVLAVSGGLDSVVLTELCQRAGLNFSIAHCNFQLRGAESQRDEDFVRGLAQKYNRELHLRRWDTAEYAAEHRISIQAAARELRYGWFRELSDCVVTAHHLDDNIETLLMNFFKGTGIAGLKAMLPRQGGIVRPLLFTGREELAKFAGSEGLKWVEDSSNASDKYTRNYIRHQIIPAIQQAYPSLQSNLAANIQRFQEIETIYRQAITQQMKGLLEPKGSEVHIPVLKLKKQSPLNTLVYEIITPYGFSAQQTGAVIALLDSGSGKYVCSATHRILKDRAWLIISPLQTENAAHIVIDEADKKIVFAEGTLGIERGERLPDTLPAARTDADPATAWIDADAIQWPLLLRPWRQGDYFYPLGMRKKKKLSRFFIDKKLSLAEKERVWVLEMDKKIVWVVGCRIDDRFRVEDTTRRVLKLQFQRTNPSV